MKYGALVLVFICLTPLRAWQESHPVDPAPGGGAPNRARVLVLLKETPAAIQVRRAKQGSPAQRRALLVTQSQKQDVQRKTLLKNWGSKFKNMKVTKTFTTLLNGFSLELATADLDVLRADADVAGVWPDTIGDYVTLNITGRFKINDWLTVYGRVDNVWDEDYEDVSGVKTAGASAYGGIRLEY